MHARTHTPCPPHTHLPQQRDVAPFDFDRVHQQPPRAAAVGLHRRRAHDRPLDGEGQASGVSEWRQVVGQEGDSTRLHLKLAARGSHTRGWVRARVRAGRPRRVLQKIARPRGRGGGDRTTGPRHGPSTDQERGVSSGSRRGPSANQERGVRFGSPRRSPRRSRAPRR
eukprot:3555739-Prymnesium_polylepis.2